MKHPTYIPKFLAAVAVLFVAGFALPAAGQLVPAYPFSLHAFSPVHFNPAIAGSREFADIGLISRLEEDASSHLLFADMRLTKAAPAYFIPTKMREYTNFGIAGSLFREEYGSVSNTGLMAAGSYHIPLNRSNTTYLSAGVSFKGIYNTLEAGTSTDTLAPQENNSMFYPNMDAGIYFYSSQFFAGFSGTNLLGNPGSADTYDVPVSRQYIFQTGYKLLLSESLNIVIEPSLLVIANDSTTGIQDNIVHPMLKLYMSDFLIGSYYDDNSKVTFFFQYRFPSFYIGTWFEIPLKTAFYLKQPAIEITAGLLLRGKVRRGVFEGKW